MNIYPEDIVEGSDSNTLDVAAGLMNLAAAFIKNEPLHTGNVEWVERWAAFMRTTLDEADLQQSYDIQRQEMDAEIHAAEAMLGLPYGTERGDFDQPEPQDPEEGWAPDQYLDMEMEDRLSGGGGDVDEEQ